MADNDPAASEIQPGSPLRLGAHWDGEGTNFALFSAHAERVELCLFDESGANETARITLPEYTNEIWHGYLPGVGPGRSTATASTAPSTRQRAPLQSQQAAARPLCTRNRRRRAVVDRPFRLQARRRGQGPVLQRRGQRARHAQGPRHRSRRRLERRQCARNIPWSKTIFYETHVKGFTQLHPAIPEELRGTFEGMGHNAIVEYIKSLGITSVELLPIHAFPDDDFLLKRGLRNYWGYNTLGFFAPASRYYGPNGMRASARWCAPSTMPASR